jgi:hypothetical protein
MSIVKKIPINNNIYSKRNKTNDILNNYTKKNNGQKFVDYLGSTFLNKMPFAIKKL